MNQDYVVLSVSDSILMNKEKFTRTLQEIRSSYIGKYDTEPTFVILNTGQNLPLATKNLLNINRVDGFNIINIERNPNMKITNPVGQIQKYRSKFENPTYVIQTPKGNVRLNYSRILQENTIGSNNEKIEIPGLIIYKDSETNMTQDIDPIQEYRTLFTFDPFTNSAIEDDSPLINYYYKPDGNNINELNIPLPRHRIFESHGSTINEEVVYFGRIDYNPDSNKTRIGFDKIVKQLVTGEFNESDWEDIRERIMHIDSFQKEVNHIIHGHRHHIHRDEENPLGKYKTVKEMVKKIKKEKKKYKYGWGMVNTINQMNKEEQEKENPDELKLATPSEKHQHDYDEYTRLDGIEDKITSLDFKVKYYRRILEEAGNVSILTYFNERADRLHKIDTLVQSSQPGYSVLREKNTLVSKKEIVTKNLKFKGKSTITLPLEENEYWLFEKFAHA